MMKEQQIKKRAKLWREFSKIHQEFGDERTEAILKKLGFPQNFELIDDPWYDGYCARRIAEELERILEGGG